MKRTLAEMRLAVVGHVPHYYWNGQIRAYAAYVREIEVWADLFREIVIVAPYREQAPPGDCIPFEHRNIVMRPQMEAGGDTARAKLGLLLSLPLMTFQMAMALRDVDAVHVRCPGNLGLLGAVLGPIFSRNLIAKYAGQWTNYPGEAATTRWQKHMLRSKWFAGPVTVYGEWPEQPDHIVPFFTSVLTEEQIARGRRSASRTRSDGPVEILFVGRLSEAKNVDTLLNSISKLVREGVEVRCTVVGDGPERASLDKLSAELDLSARVEFTGGLAFDEVLGYFENSDVLVLASETEGWPKAVTEAMAFGLICIGSNRGLVPQILGEGRGVIVPPRDAEALASALRDVATSRESYAGMRLRAAAWARKYSLEGLREALQILLTERWGLAKLTPVTAVSQS